MMGVFVMGNALAASAPGFGWLLVGRVVSAVVHSTLIAAFVAAARDTAPPDRRAAYGAKVTLGIGLSSVAGVPAGTLIGNAFGWRATFWALAAVSLAATALLTRFPAPESPRGTAKPAGLRRTAAPDTGPGRRRFVLPGPMLLVAAVITLGTAGVFALYTYASPYLTQSAGFGSGSVTVLLLLYGLGGIVGNTAGGRAADRFPSAAVPATLGAAAAGLLLLALPPGNRWAVAGVFCLLGTAYFATIPALNNAIVSAAGPSSSTMALTVNNSAFCVGIALGSWLGGLLLARGNTLPTVAAAGAASTAAALLLALLHTRLRKAPPGPALPPPAHPTTPAPARPSRAAECHGDVGAPRPTGRGSPRTMPARIGRSASSSGTRDNWPKREEQQRAERAAGSARLQAWQALRTSPYAETFHAPVRLATPRQACGHATAIRHGPRRPARAGLADRHGSSRSRPAGSLETVVLCTKPAPCVRSSSGSRPSKGVRRQANAQDPASYERRSSPHRRAAAGETAGRSTLRARQTREQIPHQ
ncbi:MFS transporter [Streptomyces sp. I3(2020)]|nr:MFS transporter [Streptomyces sp. I3(2020)]